MKNKIEVITFSNEDFSLEVKLDVNQETVWLTQAEMAKLFEVDRTRITRHINNIYSNDELDEYITSAKNAHMGNLNLQKYNVKYYNLDMIIAVGYRVNSKKGTVFRKWANSILKEYLITGYVINKKRMSYLEKTIEIQTKMLSSTLDIEIYPSIEEKAAKLLYFIVKDQHSLMSVKE